MTVALTGGTGFVGQALLDVFAKRGVTCRALARREMEPRGGVDWIEGSLSDQSALGRLVEGCSAVIHVAGVVNAFDPSGFEKGNVAGTRHMVQAAQDADISRFVFVSSLSAREPGLSRYGASKKRAEDIVVDSALNWTIVRPPAVYGPRDKEMFELFRAARYGVVPVPPLGRTSLIHVCDLAELLALLTDPSPKIIRKVFEPDDGRAGGMTHRELGKAIGRAVGRNPLVIPMPKSALICAAHADRAIRGERAKLTADRIGYMIHPDWAVSAKRCVPSDIWTPRIGAEEGLAKTARWYRQQGWL